jgi:hypothetical protein
MQTASTADNNADEESGDAGTDDKDNDEGAAAAVCEVSMVGVPSEVLAAVVEFIYGGQAVSMVGVLLARICARVFMLCCAVLCYLSIPLSLSLPPLSPCLSLSLCVCMCFVGCARTAFARRGFCCWYF